MSFVIDQEPPPAPSLGEIVSSLQPGQSLLFPNANVGSIRTVVSRIKRKHHERQFKTSRVEEGARVWRIA